MSAGMSASEPYTRKYGVNPVDMLGVVLRLHKTNGSSSIHAPGALSSGSIILGLMPARMRPFALSAWPFDWGCATDATSSRMPYSDAYRANAPLAKFVPLSVMMLFGTPYLLATSAMNLTAVGPSSFLIVRASIPFVNLLS